MTRTEFLSLADALRFNGRYGYETQDQSAERRINERASAAALLRKLAELRPVAWVVHSKAGRIRAMWSVQPDAEQLAFAALDGDIVTPLYQLSEVMTDE